MYIMYMKFASASFIALLIIFGLLSGCSSYQAVALPGDELRMSRDSKYMVLLPPEHAPLKEPGIIFYPGGRVSPESYAVMLGKLVERGHPAVIVSMPFDLAVLGISRGLEARNTVPGVHQWVIAGHSLGGAMAAWLVHREPDAFSALVLMASYPAKSRSLADASIPVLSLYAELDGLAAVSDIDERRELLPAHTQYHLIAGGNHAQFGSYGLQKDDGEASITEEDQHQAIVRALVEFLDSLPQTNLTEPD